MTPEARAEIFGTFAREGRPWYGDRLDPGWEPHNQALLDARGLTGPFWRLP